VARRGSIPAGTELWPGLDEAGEDVILQSRLFGWLGELSLEGLYALHLGLSSRELAHLVTATPPESRPRPPCFPSLASQSRTALGLECRSVWSILLKEDEVVTSCRKGLAMSPSQSRWMMFVDGENFTIQGQKVASARGVALAEGKYHLPDVYLWMPEIHARDVIPGMTEPNRQVFSRLAGERSVRSFYYTSILGPDDKVAGAKKSIWDLGFHPEVFRKIRQRKTKGVDIALTKDMLSNAFLDNYDLAVLVAGDADYVPLVAEVKRLGKVVLTAFFDENEQGMSPELKVSADDFFDITFPFESSWNQFTR
jgi:uncharacterized LabA/DUF88 family protein